ncbi:uncharacterized protein LOC114322889 isoform X1 [Camellia sinensis]|uniref:uncharacterized protein LOC114322889 isoform X1 n=1 Tax=Camellia sinensis TaxID=4442 RepID=UPI001036CC38|nr:uncharacterized protein LOC114322889 isoform X1 [Camellia sinensis]
MDVYSWFRRSVSRPENTNKPSSANAQHKKLQSEEELAFGITDQLIEFIKTFTLDTFNNFPLQDEEGASCGAENPATTGNVRKDLSDWQQQHATLVLSKVKEMAQLRFRLCPRHLKERQFWRIYFTLVKSYVTEYELRAIQLAKLRQMTIENEYISDTSACEVEMSETKQATSLVEHNLDSLTHDIESGKNEPVTAVWVWWR